jgi:MFS family permease
VGVSKVSAFNILMTGSTVSMFGTRISTIAFPLLILHLSGSALVAGLVAFAAMAPSIVIYIPAGALVDQWDPGRVLLASEFGRGIAIATVVVGLAVGKPNVWLLVLAMIAEEVLEIFSTLAERRYINLIVEHSKVPYAQACVEARMHAVVLAGRPLGSLLFEIKPIFPFLADAISFTSSVASIVYIKTRKIVFEYPGRTAAHHMLRHMGEGLQWLNRDKHARIMVVLMASTTLIAQALIMVFLAEAHARQLSSAAVGTVLAASGAGGTIGSVTASRLRAWARDRWFKFQMCAWSAAFASLALSGGRSLWWIAAALTILGFTGAVGNIEYGTYLVRNVSDGMLARVTSVGRVLAIGACALGPVLGGAAFQRYGFHGAVSLLFFIVLLLALASLRAPVPPGSRLASR